MIPVPPLQVYRCRGCGRIVTRAELAPGSVVEVKCKCNVVTTIVAAGRTVDRT